MASTLTGHPAAPDSKRFYAVEELEVRGASGDDEPPHIVGTAAVYNRWSRDLGGFKERILPGAFAKSLVGRDILALFNHDTGWPIGSTAAGSLVLTDAARGLKVDIRPPDTQTHRDRVITPMRDGLLKKMSFAFTTRQDAWREPKKAGGLWERDLIDVELHEVSPVVFPAYEDTDAAVRALEESGDMDLSVLSTLLVRMKREMPLSETDIAFLRGASALLTSFLPEMPATPDEGAGGTPDEGAPDVGVVEPQAGRSISHLMRLLDLHERELALN